MRIGSWSVFAVMLIALFATVPIAAQDEPKPIEPPKQDTMQVELSPLVTRLLDDDLLSDEQRREAMIFHGQWEGLEEPTKSEAARLRVLKHDLIPNNQERIERDTAVLLHMEHGLEGKTHYHLVKAGHLAGDPESSFGLISEVGTDYTVPSWRLMIAKLHEDLGEYDEAIQQLRPIREQLQNGLEVKENKLDPFSTAEDLTAAAEAVVMLARLEGRPAADYHLANQLLAKVRNEVDPLYWPAYVAEAELLMSKGNPRQAQEAIAQALALNPKSSEAWYLFGSMRTRFFDFDSAERAVDKLRQINKTHPLGKALAVQIALRQKDMDRAEEVIASALDEYPTHRKLLALSAAVHALSYDEKARDAALAQFQELAPGNPLARFEVGQALSDAKQYELAEPHLKEAIRMLPGWSEPQLALGRLYMDWGKLEQAATQLQAASSLDPFHKAITNQLLLANEMLGYETIKTDQFLVRYLPGVDEVLARDVAMHMGGMVESFIQRFDHDPPGLTQVDLMPDDQHFAVRILGLPEIWTIAACTGDVIAMTPPRPGPKRAYGAYNWLNVMGHEYVHVVNLSQTDNRVPHWFTEGCAVQMETTGRLWSQYTLLAESYNNDKLFDYDKINWGFIRPTEEYHRPLAYAQSAWIMQYIEEEHGWGKALQMLELYQQGVGEHEVLERVFGVGPDAFMEKFLGWAGKQVEAWGMASWGVKPEDETLARLLSAPDAGEIDAEALTQAIKDHPDEPGLVRLQADRALRQGDLDQAEKLIQRYQKMRPVDPWSDRELAKLALSSGDAETAVASLRRLDEIEGDAPEYAIELARVYRGRKDFAQALHYAERALLREPYNATYRELAATISVQDGDLARAAFHIESLELLEPDRAVHPKRLSVIYKRLGRDQASDEALERAGSLE